ncbi:type II toxin-antitoxin system HicB family antitoxin [Candidatus Uhrbacteria bacterium]|nr:type II toxin-antitoxin system HicB family antitoxin [Candidatus Uhrbacteria bacterium]
MKSDTVLTYTVYFQPAEEGGYVASVPALPGCMSQGETFEETRTNIGDAIKGYLAVLTEDGDVIPEENEYVTAQVSVDRSFEREA